MSIEAATGPNHSTPISVQTEGIRRVHFLGICGTAMGSVAVAMAEEGFIVTGSDDAVYPPMSTFLEDRGITISKGYAAETLPGEIDLVVVGNAMSRGNPAVEAVLNRKLPYLSLPETLKFFFLRGRHNLVVTGTHGKTTTTSMLAWIFQSAGREPSWLIGGLPQNLGQGCRLHPSKFCILEGDEYDTAFFDKRSKFVHYLPETVVVNNLEFDHADIFASLEEIKTSFRRLLNIVPGEGLVLLNADDPNVVELGKSCPAPILEVGFSENAGEVIRHPRLINGQSHFELWGEDFVLPMIGDFNIRNAAMAAVAAHNYGISREEIRHALATFSGVRRRQELRGEVRGIKVIDDFGHHPTAIAATLQGLRNLHASARLWAIFEPRSNTTRRAVFQEVLPKAFADADGVVLAPVARLEQLPEDQRLDPNRVVADIARQGKIARMLPTVGEIVAFLVNELTPGDVVVVFSNGGFDNLHEKLLAALAESRP